MHLSRCGQMYNNQVLHIHVSIFFIKHVFIKIGKSINEYQL